MWLRRGSQGGAPKPEPKPLSPVSVQAGHTLQPPILYKMQSRGRYIFVMYACAETFV